MKSTKFFSLILVLILVVSLGIVGCQSPSTPDPDPNGNGDPEETWEFTMAHHLQLTHPAHAVYEDFAEKVKAKTNGRVTIEILGAGQIGGLRDNTEGTAIGTVDMALVDFGTLALKHPRASVTALPFIFNDYDHVFKFLKSDVLASLIEETAEETGVRVLAFGFSGFRQIYSDRPISKPEDMNGMKIRVPEITLWIDTFEALGAIPTPIAYGELYTALQTGVVDACELPSESQYSANLHEQTKYIANTGHIFTENHIGMNEEMFQSLPADIQKALLDAAEEAYAKGMRQTVVDGEQHWIDLMLAAGLIETEVDKPAFISKVQSVWEKYANNTGGQDIIDGIRALVN